MSLRLRLSLSMMLALLLSLAVAAALACWHAGQGVYTELAAAMEVGGHTVQDAVEALGDPGDAAAEVNRIIRAFDGDRHVRAILLDARGAVRATSHPLRAEPPVPGWFVALVAPHLPELRTDLPASVGGGAVVLRAEPANEAGEKWSGLGDSALDLGLFGILACFLTLATASRALRPLDRLAEALDRVGPGNHGVQVPAKGPPDVARLAEGFNRMEERLAAVEVKNRRLTEQLLCLQDEERTDLARDLHDEVGPFLFSIQVGAAGIERLVAGGTPDAVLAQAALIREDVAHIQKQVRGILARLRPVPPAAFGLAEAIEDMLAFWRARNPGIIFDAQLDPEVEEADEAYREVAYRVVQEAISNALRHSRPTRVEVAVRSDADQLTVRARDDGVPMTSGQGVGFGLDGMRERLTSLGGTLSAGPRTGGSGWEVLACLPWHSPPAEAVL